MSNGLQGKRIAFLAADGVEQVELTASWKAIDGRLVSSRKPDDLPAFCATIVEEFAESHQAKQAEKTAAATR